MGIADETFDSVGECRVIITFSLIAVNKVDSTNRPSRITYPFQRRVAVDRVRLGGVVGRATARACVCSRILDADEHLVIAAGQLVVHQCA